MATDKGLSNLSKLFKQIYQENVYRLGVIETPATKAEIILKGLDTDSEYTKITCNRTGKVKYRKEDFI